MESATLWQEFAATGDLSVRDQLLNEHLGLVHHVARQLSRSLSAEAELDELVSAGSVGLMSALEAFDSSRGLSFSTFAIPRIRGAMLDELRRQDHVPRSIRRKARDIGTAREALTRAHGAPPDDRAIAAHLEIDVETLWRWQSDIEGGIHLPLDRTPSDPDGRAAPADILPGETGEAIEDRLTLMEEVEVLRDAILELKEQERIVLSLYYFEDLKLQEIAEVLELTASRVSQIRTAALSRLRTRMAPLRQAA